MPSEMMNTLQKSEACKVKEAIDSLTQENIEEVINGVMSEGEVNN